MPASCPSSAPPRRHLRRAAVAGYALALAACGTARADIIYSTALANIPQDSAVRLLDLGSASGDQLVSTATRYFGGANAIVFTGGSGIFHGTNPTAAAPTLNGSKITTNYFAAEPGGAVTYQYTAAQKYFGLLWGSVDGYNALSFYDGDTLLRTFVGNDIKANPTGSQLADGSFFVSFNFTASTQFTRVVATSTSPAFEFNTVAYSPQNIPLTGGTGTPTTVALSDTPSVPAPGGAALVPAVLALGLLHRWGRRGRGLTRAAG